MTIASNPSRRRALHVLIAPHVVDFAHPTPATLAAASRLRQRIAGLRAQRAETPIDARTLAAWRAGRHATAGQGVAA